jgi:uncharacterized membrane protein
VATLLHSGFTSVGPTGLIVLAGALSYALAIFRLRRLSSSESSEAIGLHMSLTAGAVMLVIALPALRPIPREAWLPLLASALAGGFGQAIIGRALCARAASKLAAFSYAGVVFTYLLEARCSPACPAAHQVVGALIVVGAGVLVCRAPGRAMRTTRWNREPGSARLGPRAHARGRITSVFRALAHESVAISAAAAMFSMASRRSSAALRGGDHQLIHELRLDGEVVHEFAQVDPTAHARQARPSCRAT